MYISKPFGGGNFVLGSSMCYGTLYASCSSNGNGFSENLEFFWALFFGIYCLHDWLNMGHLQEFECKAKFATWKIRLPLVLLLEPRTMSSRKFSYLLLPSPMLYSLSEHK